MNESSYSEFIDSKRVACQLSGFEPTKLNGMLFAFQRDIVCWALRKGKAAIFADCGMGKTAMQLEWAHHVHEKTGGMVLILAPLAVSSQTVSEGEKFGIAVNKCRTKDDLKDGINITNYEMLSHFDDVEFAGIILDESSILKSYTGATRNAIIERFVATPYRLACTGTPAPNDFMELGNHSEFLGCMTRTEMLAMFFIHDGGDTSKWRLKGHASSRFWEWVSTWAVMVTSPADLGYQEGGFKLPELHINTEIVQSNIDSGDRLFNVAEQTLMGQQKDLS